jgi:predicted membrane protein
MPINASHDTNPDLIGNDEYTNSAETKLKFQLDSRYERREASRNIIIGIIGCLLFIVFTLVALGLTIFLARDRIFTIVTIVLWILWGFFFLLFCACLNSAIVWLCDFVAYRRMKHAYYAITVPLVRITVEHETPKINDTNDSVVLYNKSMFEKEASSS